MSEKSSVVAVYKSHTDAENAVKELQRAGFPMTQLSIVGRDYHSPATARIDHGSKNLWP